MINFAIEEEGYNKAQVDGCIERIEMEYQKLYLENQALHSKLEQVQRQLVTEKEPRARAGRLISNIAFYGTLVLLLVLMFIYTQSGTARNIFGYSYYNILTTSMQSTIPQGSFILVKETPAQQLKVGDDITFFKNADTIVTHRIIDIYEDYEDSGQYGFRTQGTDNPAPDANITYEGNVIGRVIFQVPMLGFVLEYIANHIWIVVIGFALLLALAYFLRIIFTPEKAEEDKPKHQQE